MDPASGLKILQDFGVAALFIAMYLSTVWYLIRQLVSHKEDYVKQAVRNAEVIEAATQTITDCKSVMLEVKKTVGELNTTVASMDAYGRGRDERRRP
jgi:hypothetical protein